MSFRLIYAALATLVVSMPSIAAPLIDPAGDFLPTYTGPHAADLDALSAQATFDGSGFDFTATMAGNIGTTPGGFYVFGINRGAGTARFGALAPDLLFDAVVSVSNDGTGFVSDLISGVRTNLGFESIRFDGASLGVSVAAALLPGRGRAPADFGFALWPRSPGSGTSTIADFAPDKGNSNVAAVPEPEVWAMMLAGFGLAGAAMRDRRKSASRIPTKLA